MSSDSQAQEDELLALASIYDDPNVFSTSDDANLPAGQFSACIELPENFEIKTAKLNEYGQTIEFAHIIRHLPPITMYFELPADYPSVNPPQFTLSCKWLSLKQLSTLCKKLDDIWTENEGMEILFLWISLLKDEVVDYLQIQSPLDISKVVQHHSKNLSHAASRNSEKRTLNDSAASSVQTTSDDSSIGASSDTKHYEMSDSSGDPVCYDMRAVQDIASQDMLYPALVEYDKQQCAQMFQMTLFMCQVCFTEKLGSICIRFSGCDHVYCKECMKGYFEVQIEDGNVQSLRCPYDKCESEAYPGQVKELVDMELFTRYDRLLLQSSLDTMSDIMYCPRQTCGCVVMADQDSAMATCPSCSYVFCIFCKLVYHGVSPCRIKGDELRKLREQYLNATSEDKKLMERRYGRKAIQQVVEDSFSQEWLAEHSKKCPKCSTHIQKIDGCNKMTCTKCRCFFCWICNAILSRNNPYLHYNSLSSDCFNKLFQGVAINDDVDFEEDEDVWYIEN